MRILKCSCVFDTSMMCYGMSCHEGGFECKDPVSLMGHPLLRLGVKHAWTVA